MEQAYPSPQFDLDDSPLGRFRWSTGFSGSRIDFSRLSHHSRTGSNISDLSSTSPPSSEVGPVNDPGSVEDESDFASMASGISVFAVERLNDNGSNSGRLEQANILDGSTANSEYCLVQDALIGPAPFTKPHFISGSLLAPFSGPHAIIELLLGPDLGKYIHIPHDLRAADIKLAELAIYWLWSGARRNAGAEEAKTDDFGPKIPALLLSRRIFGPPEAPYSMTESTYPPFLGPRTFILNTGAHLNGWLLHVPRYLNPQEIAIASNNLCDITNEISSWGFKHDFDCTRGAKRSEAEYDVLMKLMEQQDRNMALLKDIIGLNFAAHDEQAPGFEPIWKQRIARATVPETPKKHTLLPTPPTTINRNLHSPYSFSSLRSVAKHNVRHGDDVRAGVPTPNVEIPTSQSVTQSNILNAPSGHERVVSYEAPATAYITDELHESAKLPTLTRYGVVMEQEGELVLKYPLDDPFTSNSGDERHRTIVVQVSSPRSQAPRVVQPNLTSPHSPQIAQTSPSRHRTHPVVVQINAVKSLRLLMTRTIHPYQLGKRSPTFHASVVAAARHPNLHTAAFCFARFASTFFSDSLASLSLRNFSHTSTICRTTSFDL